MTRQTRTLLITFAVAMVGLTALWLMAERYRKLVEQASGSSEPVVATTGETAADVEYRFRGFLKIRAEIHGLVQRARVGSDSAGDGARLSDEIARRKDELLAETGLSREEYEEIREARSRWIGGGEVDVRLRPLFEEHREAVIALDLGEFESFDSASGV